MVKGPNDRVFQAISTRLRKNHQREALLLFDTRLDAASVNRLNALSLVFPFPLERMIVTWPSRAPSNSTSRIHAIYRPHTIPVIYAQLRRKNTDTYSRSLDEIAQFAFNWVPTTAMTDFEQVSINAEDPLQPDSTARGFELLFEEL